MKITKNLLTTAVEKGIINSEQCNKLIDFLQTAEASEPSFNFSNVLYYFGGLIAIGAMTFFMNLGWEAWGGAGIFFISLPYAVLGLALASLFRRKGYVIPAGICATFVVALTPLAIYGIQKALGFWPSDSNYNQYYYYIRWHWLYMELGTLAVGMIIAYFYKYPFLLMPIAMTLWFISMDVTLLLFGQRPEFSFDLFAFVSLYFGLAMTLLAFWIDVRSRKTLDYAFWLYIFGVLTFWGGLTSQHSDSELSKFFYFCINLFMIGVGVLLVRRVFVIFGAIGCSMYLVYLASTLFKDSVLFPVALTVMGLLIIYLGILWQKNERIVTQKARAILPAPLRELLDAKRIE